MENNCSICYDNLYLDEYVISPCNHIFHKKCIAE